VKTWILLAIEPAERSYAGHSGSEDNVSRVYGHDSFVPNCGRLSSGDLVVIRGKKGVYGSAVVQLVEKSDAEKLRLRCPQCEATKLKERRNAAPKYRCECGAEFDAPTRDTKPCVRYEERFGDSFSPIAAKITVGQPWAVAPRLNKQMAILELDYAGAVKLPSQRAAKSSYPNQLPTSVASTFAEVSRVAVLGNRDEGDPRARRACIAHYGCRCVVCGFDFAARFGVIGEGIIEVHHLDPLGASGERVVDLVRALRPVCPNCHTVMHRATSPPFTGQLACVDCSTGPSAICFVA
jgi:hypothetical protein